MGGPSLPKILPLRRFYFTRACHRFTFEAETFEYYHLRIYPTSPGSKSYSITPHWLIQLAFFNHSRYVEMAFTELELKGIPRQHILAVPLDRQYKEPQVLDSLHRSDERSLLDGAATWGTVFMVLGVIYGFVWKGGPILWGLIGLIGGAGFGLLLDYAIGKLRRRKQKQPRSQAGPGGTAQQGDMTVEISVIVNCQPDQSEMVERVLWQHFALAVGQFEKG